MTPTVVTTPMVDLIERGRLILRNVVQGTHGVEVEVGRLPLGQLDAGDAQRPDVDLPVVLALVHRQNHLRRHPVGRPHEGVRRRAHRGGAKVGQLDGAHFGEEDVPRLDVPVDAALVVQVLQPLQAVVADGGDLLLAKRLLVHWKGGGGKSCRS